MLESLFPPSRARPNMASGAASLTNDHKNCAPLPSRVADACDEECLTQPPRDFSTLRHTSICPEHLGSPDCSLISLRRRPNIHVESGIANPKEWALREDGAMNSSDRAIQYGVVPTGTAKTISGLELLTAIMEGRLPAPPIQKVLDFRLVEVARGYTAFSGSPKFEYYNPLGTVTGGYTAAPLHSCMACAVHSTLDAGWSYATLEIKINYVRPITF